MLRRIRSILQSKRGRERTVLVLRARVPEATARAAESPAATTATAAAAGHAAAADTAAAATTTASAAAHAAAGPAAAARNAARGAQDRVHGTGLPLATGGLARVGGTAACLPLVPCGDVLLLSLAQPCAHRHGRLMG